MASWIQSSCNYVHVSKECKANGLDRLAGDKVHNCKKLFAVLLFCCASFSLQTTLAAPTRGSAIIRDKRWMSGAKIG